MTIRPISGRWRAGTPSGDRQLMRAAALGDISAWDALVDEYAGTVWSTCVSLGLRHDESASVSQLVWLGLVDALPHLDGSLMSWLVATTTQEARQARDRTGGGAGRERRARPRPSWRAG